MGHSPHQSMESPQESNNPEDWINELRGPLTRFALSLGLSSHDAEDAVQDGLIALVRTLEKKPDSILNPKAYAFTIIRNNANKRFRERTRRNEVEMPEHLPEIPDEDDIYQEPLIRKAFQSAYANLSVLERDLLQKYYVEKWTYEQIGSELGCSAQNAWKTIKKIVSNTLTGEVRKALALTDPQLAKELLPH